MENSVRNDAATLDRIDAVKIILKTLTDVTGLPYSIVARVTEDSWTACAIHDTIDFGLKSGDELVLKTTYCNTVTEHNAPLLVRHASQDPQYKDHPALATYSVESYLGVPLFRQNGEYFGVLCSLHVQPHDISDKHIAMYQLMASLIAFELEAEEQRTELDEALKLANQNNEARARFLGTLGHDLRSPLNTIVMAAHLLQGGKLDADKSASMAEKIMRTSRRMQFLIEDLLDASQSAQGNQILLQPKPVDLAEALESVVDEFRLSTPGRRIEFTAGESFQGNWDSGRLGQLLSNLLSNAISYGSREHPVNIALTGDSERVLLTINNRGDAMSDEVKNNLFTPFWRGAKKVGVNENSSGLGLGLFIVKQIVDAHKGSISVESDSDNGTNFIVSMPRD